MSFELKAAVPRLASTILLLARSPQHAVSQQQRTTSNNASRENDLHVLMMKRHSKARFMPSFYVFPGGGIEGIDYVTAKHYLAENYHVHLQDAKDKKTTQDFLESCAQPSAVEAEVEAWACRVGALRELAEETACVLRRDGHICTEAQWITWQKSRDASAADRASTDSVSSLSATPLSIYDLPAVSSLRPVARWVSPRQFKHRYDTYFYAALVDSALVSAESHEEVPMPCSTQVSSGNGANPGVAARRIPPQELPLLGQASEVSELLWISPLEALRRHEDTSDSFSLAPPTYLILHALSLQPGFASMAATWEAEPPSPVDAVAKSLGELPYSSVLPCVEPISTTTEDGHRIIDFALPARYFHETGWSMAEGEYLVPGANFAEYRHFIRVFVGRAGVPQVGGATADRAYVILH
ncbi:hypothetical protein Q4I28_003398 [Leishmania naiffi]|uniref:Nudix hydrolase domain-containing protein n=1 Tax=Leishmania naiffi TaxID=5678 RepID=A0AAW3BSZ9_9TRYP